MKKNGLLIFTRILYIIYGIGTILAIFIVYKNLDNYIAFKFLIGYLLLTLFLVIYIPVITILNSKKLKWSEIRKRLIKFIMLFIVFGTLNYGLDYIFRPSNINIYREFSIALGLSFGISFFDIIFFKNKKK